MFPSLVLFLRHYSLKRTVVRAEDVENATAGISTGEPKQIEEYREERVSEPANDSRDDIMTTTAIDVDEERSLGSHYDEISLEGYDTRHLDGHDVTEMRG
jgi:hypothetical protein